ncbi:MAG TPA: glutathione S-transferase [Beijerinckiaceae bacterium]|nr:glutathione S-transferase [Beijerinckiaceae bacterium]
MKLYDGGRVPNARRVRVFLAEKGVSVPTETVDLGTKQHKSRDFSTLNPLQRVPVLVLDDGTILTESIAICRYFEEVHPEPPLFGEGARGRALVEMWQRRLELHLFLPVAYVFRHLHPAMADFEVPQVPAWGEANRARVHDYLAQLDRDLSGKDFVCENRFSVADITGMIAIDFMKAGRIDMPPGLTNVTRWHAGLAARPSARA